MLDVPRETMERLCRLVELVRDENTRHNLIGASTLDGFWRRHIEDSLQLLDLVPSASCDWLDVGSGAGFPGMVVALASDHRVTLVEPRRRRAEFLQRLGSELGIDNVAVATCRVETLRLSPDVISARAVAPLATLFGWALTIGAAKALQLYPKGRSAASELDAARASWHGDIRLVASTTAPGSWIVVARGVTRRSGS